MQNMSHKGPKPEQIQPRQSRCVNTVKRHGGGWIGSIIEGMSLIMYNREPASQAISKSTALSNPITSKHLTQMSDLYLYLVNLATTGKRSGMQCQKIR